MVWQTRVNSCSILLFFPFCHLFLYFLSFSCHLGYMYTLSSSFKMYFSAFMLLQCILYYIFLSVKIFDNTRMKKTKEKTHCLTLRATKHRLSFKPEKSSSTAKYRENSMHRQNKLEFYIFSNCIFKEYQVHLTLFLLSFPFFQKLC